MIGIDEVGRGCWAGPLLVVAARQIRPLSKNLADSKVISKLIREELFHDIQRSCDIGEGWVTPQEIDQFGLTSSMRLAVDRALSSVQAVPDETIIMDGNINYCHSSYTNVNTVIKADALHPIVSAASIYAKVKRDHFMAKISETYPEYAFEKHVGYGTKAHLDALEKHGVCDLHRLSYKPIRKFL